jgi:methionyl-tRNA formyltransferase
VVTQPDKNVGRHQELSFSPIKHVALENGIDVFQPIKIREDYKKIIDVKTTSYFVVFMSKNYTKIKISCIIRVI